jgi:hypothetical protein
MRNYKFLNRIVLWNAFYAIICIPTAGKLIDAMDIPLSISIYYLAFSWKDLAAANHRKLCSFIARLEERPYTGALPRCPLLRIALPQIGCPSAPQEKEL